MSVLVRTIGHSNHPAAALIGELETHGVTRLVDVRAYPRSRRHPRYDRPALEQALAHAGIGYSWRGDALGGFRKPAKDSRHAALTEAAFRGFADYMGTPPFRAALDALVKLAGHEAVAILCAEADFRSCHRQFISDALTLREIDVVHLRPGHPPLAHALHPALGDAVDPPVYNKHSQGDLFA